jgi:hypothetical protein
MMTSLSTTSSAPIALAAIIFTAVLGATPPAQAPNTLTADERAAGWRLLFDGNVIDQWRTFGQPAPGEGWQVVEGTLARVGRGGDLISKEQFADFEFAFDWKLAAAGGNSGVMFRVIEGLAQTYHSGPELQMLDDAGHRDGRVPETSCGANYALHASSKPMCRPIGEWNQARLVVHGAHVEHWMNGEKIVEYELWSTDWKAKVSASKFKAWPEYGMAKSGHLALQDHGSPVSFRNLKILAR